MLLTRDKALKDWISDLPEFGIGYVVFQEASND